MNGVRTFLNDALKGLLPLFGGTDTLRIVNSNIGNLSIDEFVNHVAHLGISKNEILDGMQALLVSLKEQSQPNIYTIQEVDRGRRRTNRRDIAKEIEEALTGDVFEIKFSGTYAHILECNRFYPDGVAGNALISNMSLKENFCWDLSSPNMGEEARVNAIGTYLSQLSLRMWVITVHLDAHDKAETLWGLNQLTYRLENLRNNDLVLIVGDFNIDDKMDFLYQEMLQEFRTLGYDRLRSSTRDHVFLRDHRKKLLDRRVEIYPPMWEIRGHDVKVTDHSLIIIDLKWPHREVASNPWEL